MATNPQVIADILKKQGLDIELDNEQSRIYIATKIKNIGPRPCIINLLSQRNIVEIVIPKLFELKEQIFKGVFLQTLLTLQYESSLIKFWYVPQHEAINAAIELSLVDTPLTESNLIRCINQLLIFLDEAIPRLQHVLATGHDPGKPSELEQAIAQMSPEQIQQIERIIAQRKQSS